MKKLSLVLIATGATVGAMAQIPVGVDLGVYLPTDSDVKEVFGKSWFRIGVTPLSFQRPGNWRFTFDLGFLKRSNDIFIPEGKGGGTAGDRRRRTSAGTACRFGMRCIGVRLVMARSGAPLSPRPGRQ